jgi:hypothetical protein
LTRFEQMPWKRTVLDLRGLLPDVYQLPAGVLFPYAHIVGDIGPLLGTFTLIPRSVGSNRILTFYGRKCRPYNCRS